MGHLWTWSKIILGNCIKTPAGPEGCQMAAIQNVTWNAIIRKCVTVSIQHIEYPQGIHGRNSDERIWQIYAPLGSTRCLVPRIAKLRRQRASIKETSIHNWDRYVPSVEYIHFDTISLLGLFCIWFPEVADEDDWFGILQTDAMIEFAVW